MTLRQIGEQRFNHEMLAFLADWLEKKHTRKTREGEFLLVKRLREIAERLECGLKVGI